LAGKRVLLIEDTIVRSTTMKTLLRDLRERGGAREGHVRVACPPIVAPCFYGIDMSTMRELVAPPYMKGLQIRRPSRARWRRTLAPTACCICRSRPSPAASVWRNAISVALA